MITALCYDYFRLGFSFQNVSIKERLLIGLFLCENTYGELLHLLKPEWDHAINKSTEQKLESANWKQEIENIFPFKDELSKKVNAQKFTISFLHQPKLFLRIRPGFEKGITQKLQAANLAYDIVSERCVALPNSSKIDTVELDKEAVVQDYNSQKIGKFIELAANKKPVIDVWDCCAASGGKSIMAYDTIAGIRLTVSDKRESILQNLRMRFEKAGIKRYKSFVTDLSAHIAPGRQATDAESSLNQKRYDLIIADVPCTGSGTWSRTPEQLYYFHRKQIQKYSGLQKKIVEAAMPRLQPGGHFLYITCSVFREENEALAVFIQDTFKMDIVKMELLEGYEIQSDTMFAVLLASRQLTAL